MKHRWHNLLCFLGIRNPFDYAPPFAPDVPHPYEREAALRCCQHCGAGELHAIHKPPFDPRRFAEIMALRDGKSSMQFIREWNANHLPAPYAHFVPPVHLERCPPHMLGVTGRCVYCDTEAPAEVARMRPDKVD